MNSFTFFVALFSASVAAQAGDSWPQLQGDPLRSGNAPAAVLPAELGLLGAVPLTDGIYAAPVVADGKVYVLDGSGVVCCIDAQSLQVLWTFATRGGAGNCNNVAAPAVIGKYLHVGTTAGYYYVLDRDSGAVVREIDCREPIFSAPAAGNDRVYFATLGAKVYAVEPDGNARLDLGLRQGSRQVRRQSLERRGLAQGPPRASQLARPFCLLARYLPRRQDGRDPRGRAAPFFWRRRRRRRSFASSARFPLSTAPSIPPRSAKAPMPRATFTSSGTAATTPAASKS